MARRDLIALVEEVHADHLAGQLRNVGPLGKKPHKVRRRPKTAVLANLKKIVRRGTKP